MDRGIAAKMLRDEMNLHGLTEWSARLNPVSLDSRFQYLALCDYSAKAIILNAHHVDLHDEKEILNSIRHEIAHAKCPMEGHSDVWKAKALEIGCYRAEPCSTMGLPAHVIDAIRSGATVEVEMKEEVIRTATYKVTRLQERCPECGVVAVEKMATVVESEDGRFDIKTILLECGHTVAKQLPKGTPFHKIVFDGSPDCNHNWHKTICQDCGAKRPYDFQVEGMRFAEQALISANGAIIMDEMGLGKTIQALGVLKFTEIEGKWLIIVKSGLKFQWLTELLRVCGLKSYCQVIETSRDFLIKSVRGYIIGYDMLVSKSRTVKGKVVTSGFDIAKFKERGVKIVILDECQQIKNPDSSRTQMVRRVIKDCGAKVIGLSGTPWKNRGSEFFSILNLIAPMKFSSYQGYKDRWVQTYWDGNYMKEGGIKHPSAFKEYIKDIAIRRERKDVDVELPLINRMRLHIELDQIQSEEYDETVSDFVAWYNNAVIGGEEEQLSGINILAKMSRMRHMTGLAKIPATKEYVEQFMDQNEDKLVVFAHHQDVQQILFDWATEKYGQEMYVGKITADMDSAKRQDTQDQFNSNKRAILIASALAAGEGLNLQTCDNCVMHERQWNPANEEQQEGRFIRIGSTAAKVNAQYVLAADTIDDLFDGIVERKRIQFHEAMNKGEVTGWASVDIGRELAEAIVAAFRKKHPNGVTGVTVSMKA